MSSLYAPQATVEKARAEVLAPIPAEILDQIVHDGPLTAEDVETASGRFKNGLISERRARS